MDPHARAVGNLTQLALEDDRVIVAVEVQQDRVGRRCLAGNLSELADDRSDSYAARDEQRLARHGCHGQPTSVGGHADQRHVFSGSQGVVELIGDATVDDAFDTDLHGVGVVTVMDEAVLAYQDLVADLDPQRNESACIPADVIPTVRLLQSDVQCLPVCNRVGRQYLDRHVVEPRLLQVGAFGQWLVHRAERQPARQGHRLRQKAQWCAELLLAQGDRQPGHCLGDEANRFEQRCLVVRKAVPRRNFAHRRRDLALPVGRQVREHVMFDVGVEAAVEDPEIGAVVERHLFGQELLQEVVDARTTHKIPGCPELA